MYGYLLQDWLTIRGTQSGANITQSEADWMSFAAYQDIVFWLEVKSVTLGGLTSITLEYQTAPAKDESLFTTMVSAVTLAAGTTPTITKVLLAQNPTVPLARAVGDGTYKSALAACTATNWTKLAAKFSGGTLSVRANGGSWATASVTDIDLVTGLLNMGIGYGSAYYEGLVAEIMTAQSALSDGEFDGLDAYVLARYGV